MNKLHRIASIALAASCTALGSYAADTPTADKSSVDARAAALSDQDRDFMKNAAEAGLAEVQAARLAVNKGTDQQLKNYARRLIDDHTKANERLHKLAQAKGVSLPSDPSVAQKAKLEMLQAADGADFDRRFAENLGIEAHRSVIDLFRKEVAQGRDPQVKAFAQQTLPTLQRHLQTAQTQHARLERGADRRQSDHVATSGTSRANTPSSDALKDTLSQVDESVQVVQRMKSDPRVTDMLARAKGVFIMPDYGRGAIGVGVQGGEGLLLVRRQGQGFSNPVFYDMGGISIGAQLGASGGQVALLLMTDKAVQQFESGKKFSLNADAGLTIVNWSRRAQTSTGKLEDIVVWSNAKGAYAGLSVGVNDIMLDRDANRAYYGRTELTPQQILDGAVPNPRHNVLGMVLGV